MTDRYFDLDGKPIPMAEWVALFESATLRQVAHTEVGDLLVSTVWLGLNHSFGDGPPLIFETMVFRTATRDTADEVGDIAQSRYSTKAEAEAGHASTVAQVERLQKA